MIKKCLIALTILLMFGGSVAQAHPAWGVTTAMAYEWAKKEHQIQVYMKMVRWAELYVEYAVVIVQQSTVDDGPAGWAIGDFWGYTWIEVCNNFTDLRVEFEIAPVVTHVAGTWSLSATASTYHGDGTQPGSPPTTLNPWAENETTMVVDHPADPGHVLNLTGNHGWIYLCVKATDVDPQGLEFDPTGETVMKAADIIVTYYPNLPPGPADFLHTNYGTELPRYDDTINREDVMWDEVTGGGGGIPNGHQSQPNVFPPGE